ncbi:MAG: peptide-methionine (S)-S-oxide reductase MsrA [Myxococcaceae bacterium]|nr:peptide-methionine (S)-S-oxide reductase MsrA [Myxococcaceae bacterium]MCI0669582.1 peptide-methionine (S)-S-oxide reductase MsrA [Myxococcaceae bacterium]
MRTHAFRRSSATALALTAALACARSAPASAGSPTGERPTALATFAGGCFWSMEKAFDAVPGVVSTTVGYTGGHDGDPTYAEVSTGDTGHVEAVQVTYAPDRVDYAALLDTFWHNVDPLTEDRQFCDVGPQYRSAIFIHDESQRRLAEASRTQLVDSGRFEQRIVTTVRPAGAFYPAEAYHQDYAQKHPLAYNLYRKGCGQDARLRALWGEKTAHEPPR